jgi:hypothetical protein
VTWEEIDSLHPDKLTIASVPGATGPRVSGTLHGHPSIRISQTSLLESPRAARGEKLGNPEGERVDFVVARSTCR